MEVPGSPPQGEALSALREAWDVLSARPQGQGDPVLVYAEAASRDELLKHPEKEVRLWCARCMAEVLRIFAPSPPLDAVRLRLVLELFIEQLSTLEEATGSTFVHLVGLLERLLEIRAFVLVFDCSGPEDLLVSLTGVCLAIARGRGNGRVEGLAAELLGVTLAEADPPPQSALTLLLQALAGEPQGTAPAARRAVAVLASRCPGSLSNSLLAAVLAPRAGELEPAMALKAAHELFLLEPALALRMVPSLQAELQSSDVQRRCLATKLIGRALAQGPLEQAGPPLPAFAGDGTREVFLLESHPLLLDQYLERYEDAEDEVRLAALDGAAHLLAAAGAAGAHNVDTKSSQQTVALASAAGRVQGLLMQRSLDPSLGVRLRAVEVVAEAAGNSDAALQLLSPVLPEVFRRALDKKQLVREACIEAASVLYKEHALPALLQGEMTIPRLLAWVPPLLCEVHAVLASNRMGDTARVEESIERCLLGCDDSLQADQRALAFLHFYDAASAQESGARALTLLLKRKADANAALRRFVSMRRAKGSPLLASDGGQALVPIAAPAQGGTPEAFQGTLVEAAPAVHQSRPQDIVELLLRAGPAAEDKAAKPEALAAQIRALDAVRDRSLWDLLERVLALGTGEVSTDVTAAMQTEDLTPVLSELGRVLRVHRLGELVPLLRRGLLGTWLLPDQASVLLGLWRMGCSSQPQASAGMRRLVAQLPGIVPGCFLPHCGELLQQLAEGTREERLLEKTLALEDARAAVKALGALGKWLARRGLPEEGQGSAALQHLSTGGVKLAQVLIRIPALAVGATDCGSLCRRAAWCLGLLSAEEQSLALDHVLVWVDEQLKNAEKAEAALRLATACLEQGASKSHDAKDRCQVWVAKARAMLQAPHDGTRPGNLPAAVEMLAALGEGGEELQARLETGCDAALGLSAMACSLRAIRRGALRPAASLISCLTARASLVVASGHTKSLDMLLGAMQKLQTSPSSHLRLADRLRLCSTLPAAFALSASRQHIEAAQRLLQRSLQKAVRQQVSQQEPLLDYSVACFLHFLSQSQVLLEEAAATTSSFPQSSTIATFFLEALMKSDPSNNAELATAALRVADSLGLFVDAERRDPDAMDKAAAVFRHVIEKRFPQCCQRNGPRQSLQRTCLPSELFQARPRPSTHAGNRPAQLLDMQVTSNAPPAIEAGVEPTGSLAGAVPPNSLLRSRAAVQPAVPVRGQAATTKQQQQPVAKAASNTQDLPSGTSRLFHSLGRTREHAVAGSAAVPTNSHGSAGRETTARLPGEVNPPPGDMSMGPTPARVTATPKKQRCSRKELLAVAAQVKVSKPDDDEAAATSSTPVSTPMKSRKRQAPVSGLTPTAVHPPRHPAKRVKGAGS